jgi:iron-sulfur cluster assembly accessory protein
MITITPAAVSKVREIMAQQNPVPEALRVGVRGGGCSGLSYVLVLVTQEDIKSDWNEFEFEGLKVFVDQMSMIYLEGVTIDYVETLEASGFKFENPGVKSTCGCGSSFSV